MASFTADELADFFSRACPDIWAMFIAQRNARPSPEPALESAPLVGPSTQRVWRLIDRRTVRIEDPLSLSTGPTTTPPRLAPPLRQKCLAPRRALNPLSLRPSPQRMGPLLNVGKSRRHPS
ncbi:unnamed protein product [Parnassius mnemosyne]|uniref:Uncharacterized protein n=1 Tax=Parnassius mnemosyne TaxID=213953 RepID=A0AAV1LU19_9NEOP